MPVFFRIIAGCQFRTFGTVVAPRWIYAAQEKIQNTPHYLPLQVGGNPRRDTPSHLSFLPFTGFQEEPDSFEFSETFKKLQVFLCKFSISRPPCHMLFRQHPILKSPLKNDPALLSAPPSTMVWNFRQQTKPMPQNIIQLHTVEARIKTAKMTVLTISPTATTTITISLLSPALTHSLYLATTFRRLFSTTTLFIFFRAYMLYLLLIKNSLYVSRLLGLQAQYTSLLLARNSVAALKRATRMGWKSTERLRRKLWFEFMVFVLGGGGNGLILVLFWPGWIVLGVVLGLWMVCG